MARILIVEDDRAISGLMVRTLTVNGHQCLTAFRGSEAVSVFEKQSVDLVLLDINLPDLDGFSVAKKLKGVPIIYVTARGEISDRIRGLDSGGEDYIVKPFDLEELGARVAAHLRREQRRQNSAAVRFFGAISVDYSAREVVIDGEKIPFSRREFDILELLSLNAGQIFDRERIYETVWGLEGDGNSDTVMEHIRKIRAKFGAYTQEHYIETVWGCGYKWNG